MVDARSNCKTARAVKETDRIHTISDVRTLGRSWAIGDDEQDGDVTRQTVTIGELIRPLRKVHQGQAKNNEGQQNYDCSRILATVIPKVRNSCYHIENSQAGMPVGHFRPATQLAISVSPTCLK